MIRVVSAIIVRDNQILLQQRSPHRDYPMLWETPGGKIEEGETDQQALRRELREELGLEVPEEDIPRGSYTETYITVPPVRAVSVHVAFYQVAVPRRWQPVLLDAVGVGWFDIALHTWLPLIPGNFQIAKKLMLDRNLLNTWATKENYW